MTAPESVVLGIVSGVLTSFLVLLANQLVRKVLIPWYQQLIYSGIDISGDWQATVSNPSGNVQNMVMSIEQRAANLSASLSIAKRANISTVTEIKAYSVEGQIHDRFVSIAGKNTSKRFLGIHLELLEVVGDGQVMIGKRTWYSATERVVTSEDITWRRTDTSAQLAVAANASGGAEP